MTSQTTPDPVDVQPAGGEPARPRRRRATRSAAAPTPAGATTSELTGAPASGAQVVDQEQTVTAAAAAPTVSGPTDVQTAEPSEARTADEPTAGSELPAEPAPAPRRRRAVRRTAAAPEATDAPTESPASEQPVIEQPVPEQSVPEQPTEPRTSGRRSATRRGRAAAEPAAEDAQAVEPVEPTEDEEAEEQQAAAEPTSAPEPPPAAPVSGYEIPQAPRLATTALLFQAPDPALTRQRRRRAQVGAGSPEEISEAARRAERAAAAVAAVELGTPSSVEDVRETPVTAEGPQSGRSRRRRGRGRGESPRGTVASDEQLEPAELDAMDDEDADVADREDVGADTVEDEQGAPRRRRRRGGRGRRARAESDGGTTGGPEDQSEDEEGVDQAAGVADEEVADEGDAASSRRRRRRRRGARTEPGEAEPRTRARNDEVTALRGSTRLEAKRQRRREGRDAGRRRQIISEAEFLARRESVDRAMVVREAHGRTQIAVLEDGVLVEHYVSNQAQASMVGNVYLGRVQNVLPSMEAAFVDVGKGRNAVLYAGEVNWDAAGLEGQPRRIEQALKSGDAVLVQVTKDPIGHKGARLTSQVTLAGRYLVYVPGGGMTGISRKLPDTERARLKRILRDIVPDSAGVIVRTAAEGASEDELRADIARLRGQWEAIEKRSTSASAPALLQGEPDMAIRVVRDIFNDDFTSLLVQGEDAWSTISGYIGELAPDLAAKVTRWTGTGDVFAAHRVDEQLAKGMDRKVWLPSGGSLVIDRTEAMTVIDVNTGKFTGVGGTLEETVTRNNLEAAEEIVRQLRLRDIGGIIVVDFIDMVLESNRDLVLRRLVECLGRDRTKHQVAEVTSLGLVQMTRKRVGQGLVEAFSETCEHCHGRGFIVHTDPIERNVRPDAGQSQPVPAESTAKRSRRKRGTEPLTMPATAAVPVLPEAREAVKATLATIAAAAAHAHEHGPSELHDADQVPPVQPAAEALGSPAEAAPELLAQWVPDEVASATVEAVPVEEEPTPVQVVAAPEVPVAPVLDVFAELAALGVATEGNAAIPEPHEAEPDDQQLSLLPVDPDLFAAEADEADGAEGDDRSEADAQPLDGPDQV